MEERLQKVLARAGYGSRRANEELILAERVRVNGQIATLGMKADPEKDSISVDGKNIGRVMPQLVYVAAHKPRMMLSDDDPQDTRPKVRDMVPVSGHLFVVGRLDFESEGLILLTNDGELAHRLTHPRYEHEKEYRVLVANRPDEQQLATWRRGVVLEDGSKTAPAFVKIESLAGKGTWLTVVLKEGRKRQIREIGKTIGLPIVRIVRVRIGTLQLGSLKSKEWRYLNATEVASLKQLQDQEKPTRKTSPAARRGAARPTRMPAGASKPTGAPGRRPPGASKNTGVPGGRRPLGASKPPVSGRKPPYTPYNPEAPDATVEPRDNQNRPPRGGNPPRRTGDGTGKPRGAGKPRPSRNSKGRRPTSVSKRPGGGRRRSHK